MRKFDTKSITLGSNTVVVGARACGKTTLVSSIVKQFLDEEPSTLSRWWSWKAYEPLDVVFVGSGPKVDGATESYSAWHEVVMENVIARKHRVIVVLDEVSTSGLSESGLALLERLFASKHITVFLTAQCLWKVHGHVLKKADRVICYTYNKSLVRVARVLGVVVEPDMLEKAFYEAKETSRNALVVEKAELFEKEGNQCIAAL